MIPRSGAMTPHWPSNRLYIFPEVRQGTVRSRAPAWGLVRFAQLATGFFQPTIYTDLRDDLGGSLEDFRSG